MENKLILFNSSTLKKLLKKRPAESKFGEHIKMITDISNIYEELKTLDVEYVVLGLPEDVGVFANYGKSGTSTAWDATIKILLNIQANAFTHAKKVLILGHLNFDKALKKLSTLDQNNPKDVEKARKLVSKIDIEVSNVIYNIVKAGKKPIIIGGGHNNAYGNLKGASLALNSRINVVNFDAHSDFRKEEGRHSGNGFKYAFSEGFLRNYFIFGLHENYTSSEIFKTIKSLKNITYNTFESMVVRKELKFKAEMSRALNYVSDDFFGIEIDCDSIQNIPSSAMTPSGFSVNETRQFVSYFAKDSNATYLHICEAAPSPETETQVGKLITYLITDFIRANANRNYSI
ncbi:formimidoylglutamase [Xanthomarina sp. F2636L]|uniref:formimidoylglutamase n=1 Tax=Xanthomarina sp. F2636L TaxID=2996018 RepID=UPI00225E5802|nr:formimidoylglutamase [Xanthomarina sp. F2636L]MCX7549781.1 formimidoylglutamase [Xanthomarina sp. F2636L]